MKQSRVLNSAGWLETKNLANLPEGTARSILGYAGESLVIGRALACGFNLFFKAWRDSKYDAVLDADGELFRIEIKQTGNGKDISCTSGGRSGRQINRNAGSREAVISTKDSDFLIGVNTFTGKCWIIPTEVIQIRNRLRNSTSSLEDYFEKWTIFTSPPAGLKMEEIRKGFMSLPTLELKSLATRLGIIEKPSVRYKFYSKGHTSTLKAKRHWYILEIWRVIYSKI